MVQTYIVVFELYWGSGSHLFAHKDIYTYTNFSFIYFFIYFHQVSKTFNQTAYLLYKTPLQFIFVGGKLIDLEIYF